MTEARVNLNPETYVEGGLFDDVDALMTNVKFEQYDYDGKSPVAVPALGADIKPDDAEKPIRQYWSMGDPKKFAASKDGKSLVPLVEKAMLAKTSNGAIFMKSLVEVGFPADKLNEGDISVLDGLKAHFVRIPEPERKNLKKEKKGEILVVTSIINLPGEEPKTNGDKGDGGAAAGGGDVTEEAVNVLTQLVVENDGKLAKKDIAGKAMKVLAANPNKGEILKLYFKEDFIKENFNLSDTGEITLK